MGLILGLLLAGVLSSRGFCGLRMVLSMCSDCSSGLWVGCLDVFFGGRPRA